jgi:two-component system, sensor histidine kinase and response regulator
MGNSSSVVILNVEDNEETRYARTRILQRAGFVVREAINGASALTLATAEQPAVVLLNAKLPDIDGFDVCRQLKKNPATASTMVLQVSANLVEHWENVRGLDGSADGYLTEPMTPGELVATVHSYVRLHLAEEKLAATNRELHRHARDLQRSNDDLQQFAYAVSHDLQEPLRAIGVYTQLLTQRYQDDVDEEVQEFARYITEGVERMQALIADLLQYSRIEKQDTALTLVDCTQLLDRALRELHLSIEDTHAEISYDTLPTVWADGRRLTQVFRNLLSNALKFHGVQPPRVHVSAQREDDEWLFTVQDNGIGIDPQFHERIFLIFQRLHARHEYPGTGIGLALCKKIVEQHGGRLWVESRPGKGATFKFTLPVEQHYDA